ncbi:MAG TPA: nickel pincer cofactor biosynthesis protein LarC [Anaerolineae bacterium]|nr:nickel pincer cofactor biosynthesis protein LarC [Anaerolineae bacterium]
MSTVLYLDLFSGASGDMLLGALLDAGLPLEALQAELEKMDLAGYELVAERQVRHGLSGTRLLVRDVAQAHPARHLPDIRRLLQNSALSSRVQEASMAVFARLARVEARIHGVAVDEVHFHEIGAVDSLVDVVGFAAGLEQLQVERVFSSPVPLGSGTIETEHGLLPVPAPATLALLAEVGAPTRPHPAQTEIVTPTAAALLAEWATFELPPMRVRAIGYGFGQKEFPWVNAVRVWLGEEAPLPQSLPGGEGGGDAPQALHGGEGGRERDQVTLLECNLDDTTGETLGYAMERLFAAGALDVWFTPIQMKKDRPGVMLSVLVPPGRTATVAQVVLRETPTLGLRVLPIERMVAERHMREVETPWGKVQVKEKWLNGERAAVSPEYEDCARIAREHAIPLYQVFEAARKAGGSD